MLELLLNTSTEVKAYKIIDLKNQEILDQGRTNKFNYFGPKVWTAIDNINNIIRSYDHGTRKFITTN